MKCKNKQLKIFIFAVDHKKVVRQLYVIWTSFKLFISRLSVPLVCKTLTVSSPMAFVTGSLRNKGTFMAEVCVPT